MFARNVSFRLKSNAHSDYVRAFEEEILPLLRKQKGFKDEIALSNPNRPEASSISLWESKEDAEAFHANTYPAVLRIADRLIDGTPKVHTFEVVTSTVANASCHQVAVGA
jgi:heme-degrading monooxygenase HmoA